MTCPQTTHTHSLALAYDMSTDHTHTQSSTGLWHVLRLKQLDRKSSAAWVRLNHRRKSNRQNKDTYARLLTSDDTNSSDISCTLTLVELWNHTRPTTAFTQTSTHGRRTHRSWGGHIPPLFLRHGGHGVHKNSWQLKIILHIMSVCL